MARHETSLGITFPWVLMLCMAAAVLSGCATAPMQEPAAKADPAQLHTTHGYVFASFPKPLQGLAQSEALTIRSRSDGTLYRFLRAAGTEGGSTGAWLPEGEYEFDKWVDVAGQPFASFSVKAGRVTDLGSLVRFRIGGHASVLLPVHTAESTTTLKAQTEPLRPYLASADPITWAPPQRPKPFGDEQTDYYVVGNNPAVSLIGTLTVALIQQYERQVNKPAISRRLLETTATDDFIRLAKTAAPPLTDRPAVDAEGRLYFGADFGQIRVRSASGEWSSLDTGTLHTISAVRMSGRRLLAGTDDGRILASDDHGSTWYEAARLGTGEAVMDLAQDGMRWLIVGSRPVQRLPRPLPEGLRSFSEVKVYTAQGDAFGGLAVAQQARVDETGLLSSTQLPHGEFSGRHYLVNAYPDLLRLDLDSLEWKRLSLPGEVHSFHAGAGSGVVSAFRAKGAFSRLYLSSDHGDTWKQYDAPPYVIQDVAFADAKTGTASRLSMGAFTSVIELLRYDPLADRWSATHTAPQGCSSLLRDRENARSLCVTSGGSILHFDGSNWRAEYAVD